MQATLAQTFGEALAHDAGNLVETLRTLRGDNEPRDRNMDLWNNREGRNIGKEAKEQGLSGAQLYDKIAEAVRNGRLVTDFINDPRVDPSNFDPRLIPPSITELEKMRSIGQDVASDINRAAAFVRRVDPLTLDLDGDGLETVGINPDAPILFDHDGDGIKTATGWVQSDDGFLVLDRNGNGTIDNGTELFGDSTPLYAGGTAADGFAALAQEDTNADGRVDAQDARFADLRIWRDLNQNGISEAGELFTLQDAGIVSLHVAKTENSVTLANGNQIADLGSYVRANGSQGSLVEIAGELGDLDLIEDTFHSQFTDSIPLTEQAKTLPQMNGSGQVRNMREAASLSTDFAALLQAYDDAVTRDAQQALLDDLVQAWGQTSTLAVTGQGAYAGRQVTVVFAGIASGTPEYDAWMDKLNTLERFNGHAYFTNLPAGSGPVTMEVSSHAMALLDQAYAALKDSVYDSLILQTRLAGITDGIDLVLDNNTLRLDMSGAEQEMMNRISANPVNGVADALEAANDDTWRLAALKSGWA